MRNDFSRYAGRRERWVPRSSHPRYTRDQLSAMFRAHHRRHIPNARARWRHVLESRRSRYPATRVAFRRQLQREYMAQRQLRQRRIARGHMRQNVLPQLRRRFEERNIRNMVRREMSQQRNLQRPQYFSFLQ